MGEPSLSVSAEEVEGEGLEEEAGGTSSAESPDSGKTISWEKKGESSDSDAGAGVSSLGSDDASAGARASVLGIENAFIRGINQPLS